MDQENKRKYFIKKKQKKMREDLLLELEQYSTKKDKIKNSDIIKGKYSDKKIKKSGKSKEKIEEKKKIEKKESFKIKHKMDLEIKEKHLNNEKDKKNEKNDSIIRELNSKDLKILNFKSILDIDENDGNDEQSKYFSVNKNLILEEDKNNNFVLNRFKNRTEDIVNFRKKLDIFYYEDEIISEIKNNVVVFIQGGTGCGKSTQIPQMLIEFGFCNKIKNLGINKSVDSNKSVDTNKNPNIFNNSIVMTQPRRINCVGISERINEEINENITGYKYMFKDTTNLNTKLTILTEAILLKEIKSDFLLSKYSVIILDEVHERSMDIDILMSLLSKIIHLRKKRGDILRLILMSATSNISSSNTIYSKLFGDIKLIKIETEKKYKKEEIFLKVKGNDYFNTILEKIFSLFFEKNFIFSKKSILVFLPTKEDIYKMRVNLLKNENISNLYKNEFINILPLHSGLSSFEQSKIYKDEFKIILATNIAETSITIKDVYYVFDSGRCKYKFCDENIIKYKIGFISKSSSQQRIGRIGRVADGICFRAYDLQNYFSFSDENIPEMQLGDISEVIIFIKAMGISNLNDFPWISRPSDFSISSSINYLQRLGHLDKLGRITKMGMYSQNFPIKPIFSKVLLCFDNPSYNIFALISLLNLNLEFRRNNFTEKFYQDNNSDYFVFLKIYNEFLTSSNKFQFSKEVGLNYKTLCDCEKMIEKLITLYNSIFLNNKVNFNIMFPSKNTSSLSLIDLEIVKDDILEFSKHFSLQTAVKYGNNYYFNGDVVYIDKNSVTLESNRVIFEYLVCGGTNIFLKNVTSIE